MLNFQKSNKLEGICKFRDVIEIYYEITSDLNTARNYEDQLMQERRKLTVRREADSK